MCQFLKNTKTRIDTEKNTRHNTEKTRTRHRYMNCQVQLEAFPLGEANALPGWVRVVLHACLIRMAGGKGDNTWYWGGSPAPGADNSGVGLTKIQYTFLLLHNIYYDIITINVSQ